MDAEPIRHCAACLKEIFGLFIIRCGGCKKRAYCSKDCQEKDWSISGSGQGHLNWCCLYEYGEEDIDWEVLPVENRGLGIVARRPIPAGYRILVEPVYTDPNDHPGIKDLEPQGASLKRKFKLNSFGGDKQRDGGKPFIGLRTSRVNHSCQPNACMSYDQVARVSILVAQQDIQSGEEICINYSFFGSYSPPPDGYGFTRSKDDGVSPEDQDFADIKRSLKFNWDITCPSDCYCNNSQAKKLILEGKKLYKSMLSLDTEGRLEEAVEVGENLLKTDAQLNTACWVQRADIYFKLFEMAADQPNRSEKEKKRIRQYLQSTHDICVMISPYGKITRFCVKGLNQLQEPKVF